MIAAKMFVLAHEIGHHVLEHTRGKFSELSLFKEIPDQLKPWMTRGGLSPGNKKEFQADIFATQLLLSVSKPVDTELGRLIPQNIWLGPLFTFGVLKQITDPTVRTPAHPPVDERADSVRKVLDYRLDLRGKSTSVTTFDYMIDKYMKAFG